MTSPLYLENGPRRLHVTLGKLLGEGAAGKVYAVEGAPELAVKLYHEQKDADAIEPKIAMMLAKPPALPSIVHKGIDHPQVAWPVARVMEKGGCFRGFAMPTIDLTRSTSLVNLLQKSSRRAEKLSDYYGYRVMVAHNLASMFAELHRSGHHMIDMKPANMRIYPETAWIAVVDTDGFSIAGEKGRIPAGQVSDDYIAPESWHRAAKDLGEAQDQFALAVIVFQLLNNGVHPFSGRPAQGAPPQPTDIQSRILKGYYAYGTEAHPLVKPAMVSIHKTFRRDTRMLFDRAFLPGQKRPGAAEWRDHLARLVDLLTPCQANPGEHAHFGTGCGFCLYEAQVAAVVVNAKPRPRPAPAPTPPRPLARPPFTPPSTGRNAVRLIVKPKPLRRRAPSRWRAQLGVALGIGGALATLMIVGLSADNFVQSLLAKDTPPPIAKDDGASYQTELQTFPIPVNYRVVGEPTGLGPQLRTGPGTRFNISARVAPNQRVIGLAVSWGKDGKSWIWVKLSNGVSGYLPSDRLIQVSDPFDNDVPPAQSDDELDPPATLTGTATGATLTVSRAPSHGAAQGPQLR